jgi:hypothetical protein
MALLWFVVERVPGGGGRGVYNVVGSDPTSLYMSVKGVPAVLVRSRCPTAVGHRGV